MTIGRLVPRVLLILTILVVTIFSPAAWSVEVIGRCLPRVYDRVPEGRPEATPDEMYAWLLDELLNRPWLTYMIHQPAGWHGSMTGAQWQPMTVEMQQAYTAAIGEAIALRPGLTVWVYGGLQWFAAYSRQGDPRRPGVRFDQEPWADPKNPVHVEGVIDRTANEWFVRGVTGWVFDLGSKRPDLVAGWQDLMPDNIVVGLEALPMIGNRIDWTWAKQHGLQYHALKQFRRGKPFEQSVPDSVTAFVWLRNNRVQDAQWIEDAMGRGWSLCVDNKHDELVQEVLGE